MATKLSTVVLVFFLLQLATCADFNEACYSTDTCVRSFTVKYECHDGHCNRKFLEFTNLEIVGLVVVALLIAMTNAGGVGAGTAITPTIVIFFLYPISLAIPQARVAITTGSLVTFFMTGFSRNHSNPNKFQTDYALAASITPLLLAGSQMGVIISLLFPPLFISFLLIGYICMSLFQTYRRAVKETSKEEEKNAFIISSGTKQSIKKPEGDKISFEVETVVDQFQLLEEDSKSLTLENKTKKQMIIEELPNFVIIVLSIAVLVMSSLMRGGRTIKSIIGIDQCSESGWLILLGGQMLCLMIGFVGYTYNKKTFREADREVVITKRGEITEHDSHQARINLILTTYIAGIIAGFIGVGGGMILGIYMINLGMDVFSVTALSNFMVLISSGSTTFQYVAIGAIQVDNSVIFMLVALAGSALGNLIFKQVLKKLKKPSLIVWLLFSVLWLALAALLYEAIENLRAKGLETLSFGHFC